MIEGPPVPHEGLQSPEQRRGRLEGKIALVTGGNKGIGRAVVEGFAREGAAKIYVVARSSADEVIAAVAPYGTTIHHIRADMSLENDVNRVMQEVMDDEGKIDVLVHNVGTTNDSIFEDDSWNDAVRTYETNVVGARMLTALAIREGALSRGSSVIFNSSIIGHYGNYMQEKYAETKGAIHLLVKSLSKSLGRLGIRVNSVSPGFILTDLTRKLLESGNTEAMLKSLTPLKRIGKPEDVVGAFIYLASDESSFTTGTDIVVDGGLDGAAGAMFPLGREKWEKLSGAEQQVLADFRTQRQQN